MHSFRILIDPLMLHNVRVPLLVIALTFLLMLVAGIILAAIALRREKKRALRERATDERSAGETPCS